MFILPVLLILICYLTNAAFSTQSSLLEHTDRMITDICLEAGFQSQRTFNRVFQKKLKKTPREYKNELKTKEVIFQPDEEEME